MKLGDFVYNVSTYVNNVFKPAVEYIGKQPEPASLSDRQFLTLQNFQQVLSEDLQAKLKGEAIRLELARTFDDSDVSAVTCYLYIGEEITPFVTCDTLSDHPIYGFCRLLDRLEVELSK